MAKSLLAFGQPKEADSQANAALRWAGKTQKSALQVDAYLSLIATARSLGDTDTAIQYGNQALEAGGATAVSSRQIVLVHLELARIHSGIEDFQAAEKHARAALALAESIGDRTRAASAALTAGLILVKLHKAEEALAIYLGQLPADNAVMHARLRTETASLELRRGNTHEARRHVEIAAELYEQHGDAHQHAHCLRTMSEIYAQEGDKIGAKRLRRLARDQWPDIESCWRPW